LTSDIDECSLDDCLVNWSTFSLDELEKLEKFREKRTVLYSGVRRSSRHLHLSCFSQRDQSAKRGKYFPTGDTSQTFRLLFASALRSYLIPHKFAKTAVFHDLEAFRAGAEPSWNSPNPISPTIFAALSVTIYGFCERSSTASPELEYLYGLVKQNSVLCGWMAALGELSYMRKNRSVLHVNLRYYIQLIRNNEYLVMTIDMFFVSSPGSFFVAY
jgi:hypothetical protein